uniref:Uncharacterized protein n=1 Tax=Arundo donax TaxID=35708 RepID=A0A0A9A5D6_ARUDO
MYFCDILSLQAGVPNLDFSSGGSCAAAVC